MSKAKFTNVTSDGKTADIYIYGPIGFRWWDENSWDAASFVNEFNKLARDHDRINIHINSPGGIIDEGLPIFNAIQSCEKETHTYIDGIAYSMGAIIALAAKTVHAAKNSLMLFHNASGWASGNAQDFRATAEMLDRYDSSLITSLSSKTGLSEEEVRQTYFDFKDHLLTAAEARDAGFIDIIDEVASKAPDDVSNMSGQELFAFFLKQDQAQDLTDPFFGKLREFFRNTFSFNPNPQPLENQLSAIGNALGIENASEASILDAIIALNSQLAASTFRVDELTAASQNADATVQQLTGAIDAIDETVRAAADVDAKVMALNAFVTGLRNADADDPTRVQKTRDEIETPGADQADRYEHNRAADRFLA
jgi:ATP-dependent Clp endopeptidase proteolytic subunit ClpP